MNLDRRRSSAEADNYNFALIRIVLNGTEVPSMHGIYLPKILPIYRYSTMPQSMNLGERLRSFPRGSWMKRKLVVSTERIIHL